MMLKHQTSTCKYTLGMFFTKINSKQIIDLNVIWETTKLLEDDTQENLDDLGFDDDSFRYSIKGMIDHKDQLPVTKFIYLLFKIQKYGYLCDCYSQTFLLKKKRIFKCLVIFYITITLSETKVNI